MADWRKHYRDVSSGGVTFWMDIRVDVTRQGAAYLAEHARSLGMNRSEWIRMAIAEQLIREGIDDAPELKPYKGDHLRMAVDG